MIDPERLFQLEAGQKRRKLALTFGELERDIAGIAEKGTEYNFSKMSRRDYTKAASDLSELIRKNLATYNLPARMKDLNLTLENLSLAAEDAGKTEFINSLPRSMSSDDLFALIKTAY